MPKLKINKKIFSLKLSVTTYCLLRCQYCFVKKTNKMMDFSVAKKAISLLLSSPGKKKMLIIYGGEPLLNPFLKDIISTAKALAKLFKKELSISLATNGLLLSKENLNFFKRHNIKISISIDGNEDSHNQNRIFSNGLGSFNQVSEKLPLTFRLLKKQNISAIMTVSSNLAQKMFDNFSYLIKKGFENIHLNPIQGKVWNEVQKEVFCNNLEKIMGYLVGGIENKEFVFLNCLNQLLAQKKRLEEVFKCPFYKCIEVYPQGEIAFSPFLMNLSSQERKRYILGNIKRGFIKKYQNCYPDQNSSQCQNCWSDYYQKADSIKDSGTQLVNWRNQICQEVANYIYRQSQTKPIFKKYIKEAKKRIFE